MYCIYLTKGKEPGMLPMDAGQRYRVFTQVLTSRWLWWELDTASAEDLLVNVRGQGCMLSTNRKDT